MYAPPVDSFKRRIDYLRLSVTDRCNLRCLYCMPAAGVPKITHESILRYEEIVRFARIAVEMGISKIRITGGEPLVRKDILYLCENVSKLSGLRSLSITTNGVLLGRFARDLVAAGVKRINISLDTLKPEKYAAITRADRFDEVWKGILTAQEAGMSPIKLNAVILRGINDDEIEDLGRLTIEHPFHVRFIELMPFQATDFSGGFVSSEEVLERLSRVVPLTAASGPEGNGPASHYRFEGAHGTIGTISPMSHHFCSSCNRLRLTADGKLRTCLFASEETDLRAALREGASDACVTEIIRAAIDKKQEKHFMDSPIVRKCISRPMVAIGG